jgi:hypothetical protein
VSPAAARPSPGPVSSGSSKAEDRLPDFIRAMKPEADLAVAHRLQHVTDPGPCWLRQRGDLQRAYR